MVIRFGIEFGLARALATLGQPDRPFQRIVESRDSHPPSGDSTGEDNPLIR